MDVISFSHICLQQQYQYPRKNNKQIIITPTIIQKRKKEKKNIYMLVNNI